MRFILGLVVLIIMSSCSNGSKNNINGNLSFGDSSYSVTQGSTTELKLTLTNSTNMSGAVVSINSSNPQVASVVNSQCVLSDESGFVNSCQVIVRGNNSGNVQITATSAGVSGSSTVLTVYSGGSVAPVTGLIFEPSLESVVINGDTKTYLRLISGSNVNNFVVNLSSSNVSTATLDQQTCVFNANDKICEVTINGVGIGDTQIIARSESYNLTATDTVNVVNRATIPGVLSFLSNLQVQVGETKAAELNLVGSSGVTNFVVNFTESNSNATITPVGTCQLSSQNTHCTVLVTGKSVGNDKVIASATNYQSAGLLVNVSTAVVKGYLVFDHSTESVAVGDETQIKLFYDGGQGVVNLPVNISVNNANASVSPSVCTFDSRVPHNECTITISGHVAGQSVITALATGYTSVTNNVNVVPNSVIVNGELIFTPANENVKLGSTNHLQLSLINSSNVKNLNVNLVANNGDVILTPTNCNLSTINNICHVTVKGNSLGSSIITANVVNYSPAKANVNVISKLLSPQLVFDQNDIGVPVAVVPGAGGGSSGEVLATLRLINGDPTPVVVNFPDSPVGNIQYGGWFPHQGNCILSSESPVCYFELINSSTNPVNVGTTRTAVFQAINESTLSASLTATVRNITPTARKIQVVNNCSYDSYPAIGTGSAIVSGACPAGSTESQSICYWNTPTITNVNHPNEPYKLSPGESLTFEVSAGNAMDGNGNIWSGTITNRRIESGMFIYGYCGGSPSVVKSSESCPLGQNPSNPYTGLEITFLGNGPTAYDIQNIQGVTVAATMSPTNYGQMVNTVDPYYGGIAGSLTPQVGSIFTLPGSSWSFESSNLTAAGWPIESVALFNYVIPSDTTQTTSNCSGQNPVCTTAGEVCGYSPWTISQQFVPGFNVSYAMVCGKRVGYLTLTALTAMPGGQGNESILLPFNAVLNTTGPYANSNNYPMYNFYTVSGGLGTGYGSNSNANTAGCTNWDGVTMPSSQCHSQNAAWTNNVLPGTKWIKQACPTCYSYQYDDPSSTFTNFTLIQQNTTNPTPTDGQIIQLCPSGKEIR